MNSDDIEKEVSLLKERNKRVELDKAWERSFTRRFFISLMTYVVAVLWLYIINENNIWLKAVVPTGGYILSTLSIPLLKQLWAASKSSSTRQVFSNPQMSPEQEYHFLKLSNNFFFAFCIFSAHSLSENA